MSCIVCVHVCEKTRKCEQNQHHMHANGISGPSLSRSGKQQPCSRADPVWIGSGHLACWIALAKRAGGKGPRQKSSKSVKNIFDTFRQFSRRAKKVKNRQKVSKYFSTLFDNFRAAPVFRPLLGGSECWIALHMILHEAFSLDSEEENPPEKVHPK